MWGATYPNRIEMQFCTGVDIRDIVTPANFGSHRFRRFRMAGGRISGFSIDFQRRPYPCDIYMLMLMFCCWFEEHGFGLEGFQTIHHQNQYQHNT